MKTRVLFAATLGVVLPVAAFLAFQGNAQTEPMDHMMMQAPEGASDATKGYVEAMNRMSMAMMADFSGDPDRDFIAGMIPHHQGAVDAARVVLEHGTDPEVRAFAEAIIAAQEKEIAWMTEWLAKHGG